VHNSEGEPFRFSRGFALNGIRQVGRTSKHKSRRSAGRFVYCTLPVIVIRTYPVPGTFSIDSESSRRCRRILSMRKAMPGFGALRSSADAFNPRSPCGERPGAWQIVPSAFSIHEWIDLRSLTQGQAFSLTSISSGGLPTCPTFIIHEWIDIRCLTQVNVGQAFSLTSIGSGGLQTRLLSDCFIAIYPNNLADFLLPAPAP
jgi:hypothetical protein